MNLIPIVSSLLIIIGCFLPWLQLGALFANKGIDNPDGAIMLVASIISGAVAIHSKTKNEYKNNWVFTVVGIVGLLIAFYDLNEVRERAKEIAKGVSELSVLIGESKQVSAFNFVGSGLYVVFLGAVGLMLSGLGIFKDEKSNIEKTNDFADSEKPLEIVAPKYAKIEEVKEHPVTVKTPEEIENETYKSNLIRLNNLIQKQKGKVFGGGMNEEIRELLTALIQTKQEGIHLLNSYYAIFKVELIDDIAKLNSSYEAIRQNVSLFINQDIVNDIYPHKRKQG